MPLELLEKPSEVLEQNTKETKVYTTYSRTASYEQFLDYRSNGPTRIEKYGYRHYVSPFGPLPSVTTVLSNTMGNKASLERWAAKNPGKREQAAARGSAIHLAMENWLTGLDKDPKFETEELEQFWNGMPEVLEKLENIIWSEGPVGDHFNWTRGSDNICRLWHPGVKEDETWGWAGTADGIGTYKGKTVLFDLKTSNGPYYQRHPGPDCLKSEYGMRRAGFFKLQKCWMQCAAYAMAAEHTIGIVPELMFTIVATIDRVQVFAIQKPTIEKYKQKWLEQVEKFYTEVVPSWEKPETDLEVIDGDKEE